MPLEHFCSTFLTYRTWGSRCSWKRAKSIGDQGVLIGAHVRMSHRHPVNCSEPCAESCIIMFHGLSVIFHFNVDLARWMWMCQKLGHRKERTGLNLRRPTSPSGRFRFIINLRACHEEVPGEDLRPGRTKLVVIWGSRMMWREKGERKRKTYPEREKCEIYYLYIIVLWIEHIGGSDSSSVSSSSDVHFF